MKQQYATQARYKQRKYVVLSLEGRFSRIVREMHLV
jgi:hypothetical protein